ncbi:MAG: Gfo/Idh/MocA family oxidoreductase, partial [Clostridia bacterium]|nr:Gfo/Idh/MocA family oxidoreductase [Clostridia bacterium]
SSMDVKVAMIGFGGIAKAHKRAYDRLAAENAEIRLVAVCDIDERAFYAATSTNLGAEKRADLAEVHTYTRLEEMLRQEDFDVADICLPSYLHKEYSIKLMAAGKDVLCEKPMALTSQECDEMIAASVKYDRKLMIGQCLRFDPAYLYLKECIETNRFGALRNLFMNRLSAHPMWGFEKWFTKTEKSGGCIMDMHIHDLDMARFLLGEPNEVSCVSYDGLTRWQVENTRLQYPSVMVTANGSWDEAPTFGFRADCKARFEEATVELSADRVRVFPNRGEAYFPTLSDRDRIAEEIRYFASTVADRSIENHTNTPESARKSVALVEKLRKSAAQNGTWIKP